MGITHSKAIQIEVRCSIKIIGPKTVKVNTERLELVHFRDTIKAQTTDLNNKKDICPKNHFC